MAKTKTLKNFKLIKLFFNRALVNKMFKTFPYIVFSTDKFIPISCSGKFETLAIPGPIFKTVFSANLRGLVGGPLFLLGTNSFLSLKQYLEDPKNTAIYLRWTLNEKHYMLSTFDFKRVIELENYDSNIYKDLEIF